MKKQFNFFKIALIGAVGISSFNLQAQCPIPSSIYKFNANGKKYELVKLANNWQGAVNCAVQRGGYLAEINSLAEQNGVYSAVTSAAAGVINANSTAQDGGGATYIWIGGVKSQNFWVWDGNFTNNFGKTFWQGGAPSSGGTSVNGAYFNWGFGEPDNFQGIQTHLGMALTPWPMGNPGQWNDLAGTNPLFYLIEYDGTLATNENQQVPKPAELYPSIVTDFLFIKKTQKIITEINITNAAGNKVKSISGICRISDRIDCMGFPNGVYFVELKYTDTTTSNHKFIKISK
ncbi:T9SS type A sorting domain-containing protein [Chryseobacterium sp.]|uniref:T9SS type A sorting domain-containing protein n=1 Tax=Chryseobacterium sp. TaxID=1871047 RepID=UPI000ED1CDD6|nr:T9SS type A sorting domain-containing protein [Chryseobacterium sp.]HCA07490.1 hypothetical protein [Chryseobacterium sp.]